MKKWKNSLPKNSCETTKDLKIKFEENKSKIIFENPRRKSCLKVNVDGGVFQKGTAQTRCDKLLVEEATPLFCFVELKGQNTEKAINQLMASLQEPLLNPKLNQRKIAFVVGNNLNPLSSTMMQTKQKAFHKLGADLKIQNSPVTFKI